MGVSKLPLMIKSARDDWSSSANIAIVTLNAILIFMCCSFSRVNESLLFKTGILTSS